MSIKFFPVIQDPNKAKFQRVLMVMNKPEWTDQNGIRHAAVVKTAVPNSLGMYLVDSSEDYAKEKLAVLRSRLEKDDLPIVGEFDNIEDAIKAERKIRPLTPKEKILRVDQLERENEELRSKMLKGQPSQSPVKESRRNDEVKSEQSQRKE